ncbi:hypothetical protein SLEP1_g15804 [Rubroshorea leprosula]|uniref:RNA polymerase sigma-70 region 3 domain-containing protein n=1 Tax=Rubroshorea leprosula TaxID=152421 RepID=A0AAV5IY02_9ROSI|nr:hypothetical protein SLEP1_g15804 [Rubroshorea leprosula]
MLDGYDILAINKIQKARKALSVSNGKFLQDDGIAKFTGLPLAKIKSASKFMRIVGSVDEKVGDCSGAKYLEVLPDTSIKTPEEMVLRQHMMKDIHDMLNGLGSRERQVMILRYRLKDFQPMSLNT